MAADADRRPSARRAPVVIGRISGVFGVKGWVRVYSYTDPIEGLLGYEDCLLGRAGNWSSARIAEGKRHGKGLIVRLHGIDDRDQAAALIGSELGIEREQLPEPGEGSYYWTDLEGLSVERTDGTAIGHVASLLETGANDVLVVTGQKEILIPFLTGSVIKDVDLAKGRIVVDWEWE